MNIQLNMHDIDIKNKSPTYNWMDFIIIFRGYIIPATSHGSKLCFIINLFYTTSVYDFYAILFK